MPELPERPSAPGPMRRRACTNCTTAKAKCSPFSFSPDECERCHRLGKECRYASLAAVRKRPQPNSRLQVLERKIDELAARQTYQPFQPPQSPMSTRLFNHDAVSSTSPGVSQWSNSVGTPGSSRPTETGTSSTGGNRETGDLIDRGVLTRELAGVLLHRFRTKAAEQFPFVVIPAETPLDAVRKETPLLFLAVVATMIFDNPTLQHHLGEDVRQQALQRMLSGAERSLDLLQSLLIYTAWYCHFYRADRHQEFLLSQLCVTIAHDLGIDKSKKPQVDRLDQCRPASNTEQSSSLANAQMRAYLGTYCVSSLVATTLRRRTALSYTKYMDHCCWSLAEHKEYATDELVPYLVRSQEISRRVFDTFSYDDLSNGDIRGELLVILTSDSFFRDLNHLRRDVPPSLQNNTILDLEFSVMHTMINEAALHPEFWTCANTSKPAVDMNSPSAARSKMLWQSLRSCKDFIHTFLSYQSQDLFYLTAFIYPKLCYVFVTMTKLVLLEFNGRDEADPNNRSWGAMDIVKEADIRELGKQVLKKFTAVATDFIGAEGQRDVMSHLASVMGMLMAGYEQQIKEVHGASQSSEASASMAETAQEHTGTISTTDSSAQSIGEGDMAFSWDSSTNTVWDDLFENFTMVPFS